MAIVFYLMTFKSIFKGKWVLQIIPRSMLVLHEMIFEGNLYSKFCVNLNPFFNEKWLQIYANFGGGRAGTQTAGLGCGGYPGNAPSGPTSSTTEYDGSSWSLHPASLTTGRGALNGCGTQTAAAVFGGQGPYPGPGNATEEFN